MITLWLVDLWQDSVEIPPPAWECPWTFSSWLFVLRITCSFRWPLGGPDMNICTYCTYILRPTYYIYTTILWQDPVDIHQRWRFPWSMNLLQIIRSLRICPPMNSLNSRKVKLLCVHYIVPNVFFNAMFSWIHLPSYVVVAPRLLIILECPSWLFLLNCQHYKSLLIKITFFPIVINFESGGKESG